MDVIRQAVRVVNRNQVPVITLDQPLYAIAKQIQWIWPDQYGEEKFVVVLGGLHIEMSAFKLLGDWLEDSGWIDVIVQAKVASPGIADSFLKASHLTKTRHAHQVTASSLYILLRRSYESYTMSLMPEESPLTFEEWCCQRSQDIPQFNFWYTTLRLELLVLTFIRSLR